MSKYTPHSVELLRALSLRLAPNRPCMAQIFRYRNEALQKKGLVSTKRRAEPLSIVKELLWSKDLLGSENPQTLVATMLYMNGLYFALRSGKEHRQLRFNPCQIELVERTRCTGQWSFLRYTEDIFKNHPCGLKGCKTKPRTVTHSANISNPERCFVNLFKLYGSLCPPGQRK